MTELFTIKPLEWEWYERPVCKDAPHKEQGYIARCGHWYFGVYRTELADGGWSPWRKFSNLYYSDTCASPEEGKRLAEAHWREYIKQALTPVTNDQEVSVTNEAQQ